MLPRDDPAFKKVADTAPTANLYKSGEINAIYDKWFLKPIPPKGITLNVPMSPQLKAVIRESHRAAAIRLGNKSKGGPAVSTNRTCGGAAGSSG